MAMTRITEKTALVHAGLEALIAAEAARRPAERSLSTRCSLRPSLAPLERLPTEGRVLVFGG